MPHPEDMRREIFRMPDDEARALLAEAPYVQVATTSEGGRPILRAVHVARLGTNGDALYFHGAPAGEKMEALGRPAVLGVEEVIAEIPSYFVDAERACPATTYYRSAQAHAVLEEVTDAHEKAAALAALLRKHQPVGGHVPMDAEHPLYAKAVRGLLVVRASLARVDGKSKLGQHRSPEDVSRVLSGLWARGRNGDARAIELVRRACPGAEVPAALRGHGGCTLHAWLPPEAATEAAELLTGRYWTGEETPESLARAHLASTGWVGARDVHGRLVATARAAGDGVRVAWIYDVVVAEAHRGRGLGAALVRLLLEHPAVRDARGVRLATRDAERLYARFGFVDVRERPLRPYAFVDMVLARGPR
jgi:nitroimidazol reductase NimA-like FMN-containing flavoprotein (pyridoxamine 5'-phosphate oxidase superfamily)/ribosomal protein S18 acetylase RimI-like enzyme